MHPWPSCNGRNKNAVIMIMIVIMGTPFKKTFNCILYAASPAKRKSFAKQKVVRWLSNIINNYDFH